MINVIKWHTNIPNSYAYIIPDENGSYIYEDGTYSDSKISNSANSLTEEEYYSNFEAMRKQLFEECGLSLYDYTYYYNISKKNVNVIYGDVEYNVTGNGEQGCQGAQGAQGDQGEKGEDGVKIVYTSVSSKSSFYAVAFTTGKTTNMEKPSNVGETPEGGNYDFNNGTYTPPENWYENTNGFDAVINDDTVNIFRTTKTFYSDDKNGEWTTPIIITGKKGEDSDTNEYIYKLIKNVKDSGSTYAPEIEVPFVQRHIPSGWEDHREQITQDNTCCLYCFRAIDGDGNWGKKGDSTKHIDKDHFQDPDKYYWEGPYIDSRWGEDGSDGDGLEYVFTTTSDDNVPSAPTSTKEGTYEGTVDPITQEEWHYYDTDSNKHYLDQNGVKWTDDPVTLTGKNNLVYQWVTTRRSRKKYDSTQNKYIKVWDTFRKPSLWNRYVKNGEPGTSLTPLAVTYENYTELNEATKQDGDKYYIILADGSTHYLVTGDLVLIDGEAYIWDGDSWRDCGRAGAECNYLHIIYAKKISPSIEYTADNGSSTVDAKFIGVLTNDEEKLCQNNESLDDYTFSWSKFVGDDGFGVEFVYTRTDSEDEQPTAPGYGYGDNRKYWGYLRNGDSFTIYVQYDSDSANTIFETLTTDKSKLVFNVTSNGLTTASTEFQNSDFIPISYKGTENRLYLWTDDPQGVKSETDKKYEWQASRKFNSEWKEFKGGADGMATLYGNYNEGTPGATGNDAPLLYPAGYYDYTETYQRTAKAAPYVNCEGEYYIFIGDSSKGCPTIYTQDSDGGSAIYAEDGSVGTFNSETALNNATDFENSTITLPAGGTVTLYNDYYAFTSDNHNIWVWNSTSKQWLYSGFHTNDTWPQKICGLKPSEDIHWLKMEQFDAIYTEFLIADNGKVGSAVFNGHYMFSQQGYDLLTNSETTKEEYINFFKLDPYYERISDENQLTNYILWLTDYSVFNDIDFENGDDYKDNTYYKAYEELYPSDAEKFANAKDKSLFSSPPCENLGIDGENQISTTDNTTYFYERRDPSATPRVIKEGTPEELCSYIHSNFDSIYVWVPNWCVDLYTGKMWMNHGLSRINSDGFRISNNSGETLLIADTAGNTTIYGEVFSNGTDIKSLSKFTNLLIPFYYSKETGVTYDITITDNNGKSTVVESLNPISNATLSTYLSLSNGKGITTSFDMRNCNSYVDYSINIKKMMQDANTLIDNESGSICVNICFPFITSGDTPTYLRTPTRIGGDLHYITTNELLNLVGNKMTLSNNSNDNITVYAVGCAYETSYFDNDKYDNKTIPKITISNGQMINLEFVYDSDYFYWKVNNENASSSTTKIINNNFSDITIE